MPRRAPPIVPPRCSLGERHRPAQYRHPPVHRTAPLATILIVDDEPQIRRVVRNALSGTSPRC